MPHVNTGDALLFAVTARRRLSWRSFTDILDSIFVPDDSVASDVKQARSGVAALSASLGHWDVVSDGRTAGICIAPPALARLPVPGLPRAVLCGARSPDTLADLCQAARAVGVTVQASTQHQANRYAPTRIEVVGGSADALERFAVSVGVRYQGRPAAESLAIASGSVACYIESLEWCTEPDIDWIRRDFDPDELRLVTTAPGASRSGRLNLSAYQNPAGWARQDRLWRGESWAIAHRDWSRFAVLADRGRIVLAYSRTQGTLASPRQLPIPAIPARALALCSGKPPRYVPGPGLGTHVYGEVPASIAAVILEKLAQDGSGPSCEGLA